MRPGLCWLDKPYEGSVTANQNGRKLDVWDRKLKGSHSIYRIYWTDICRIYGKNRGNTSKEMYAY